MLSFIVLSFPLATIVALVAGVRMLVRPRFERTALRASGVVTEIAPTLAQRPVARFTTAAGAEIETPVRSGRGFEALRCGDPVVVLYDPNDPTHAALLQDHRLRTALGAVLLAIGVVMLLCSLSMLYGLMVMDRVSDGVESVLTQPLLR